MKNKKAILNVLFLLIVFGLTLYYVFYGEDMAALAGYIGQSNVVYWLVGVVSVVLFIMGESVIIYYMMHSIGQPVVLTHCFLYSFVGFFFSAITPSATGGQPAQLYFMKKDKLSVSVSTLILMIVTITYKSVLVVIGVAVMILRPAMLMKYLQPVLGWCYLGVALNVFCVAFMMLLVFHPTLAENIVLTIVKWVGKVVHFKKEKQMIAKITASMEKYRSVADYLRRNKKVIINVFLITFVQRCIWFFITYLIYLSFSLYGVDPVTITTLQGMISVSVDMLPLPGGMGISENLFLQIFKPICGENLVLPVMVVSRGISYYAQLIISAVMTIVAYITIGKMGKKES
ncbi:MAG: lysylphosphatidylglycerol synthase transmembrane domain-containing protein [Butyribacter sp.]|nr:lysylphosphatidylglycerol synthase transmembrane domain-containing protein [bacterium]MDY3854027.1 lysylphosphatidylglycerol synthase transmembrane domain-containing protein [Butyribacter sp.]